MMKIAILATLFFAAALAVKTEKEYQDAFTTFLQTYKKSYGHEEFRVRYATFRQNLDKIDAHNANSDKSFTMKMNQFGDLSHTEFSKLYLSGLKVNKQQTSNASAPQQLPTSYDWRSKGAVTGVKDQGQCGSCWSFSTTGSMEGCHFITTGQLVGLSEQNLVDCSTSQGNQGCNGGLMDDAFQYIISNGGIDTESSYPYTAEDGTCSYSASNCGSTLKSYADVPSGDENALQKFVYQGPTSVAIDASQSSFQFYSSGVYYEPACSSTQLDHGVLAVGWGVDSASGNAYWIVKNSWSASWGNQGYIWMSRNRNNNCGIATAASQPSGCGNC